MCAPPFFYCLFLGCGPHGTARGRREDGPHATVSLCQLDSRSHRGLKLAAHRSCGSALMASTSERPHRAALYRLACRAAARGVVFARACGHDRVDSARKDSRDESAQPRPVARPEFYAPEAAARLRVVATNDVGEACSCSRPTWRRGDAIVCRSRSHSRRPSDPGHADGVWV